MADSDESTAPARPVGPFAREYQPTAGFRHPGAKFASVLFYRGGGHSVVTVTGAEHHGKRLLARPHTVCEILLGTYVTTLELRLPAAGGATFFQAEVDIHWSAADPHLVAVEVVTDVAARLTAPILERLRQVSVDFPVHEATRANQAITAECASGKWDDLGSEIGLRVRLYVRLTVDAKTIAQQEDYRDKTWSSRQAELDHERTLLTERQETQLLQLRMARFREMLSGDQWDQLSFMLADNPGDARAFMEQLRQEGRTDHREFFNHALRLIEKGVVHSADLEQQVREQLNRGPYRVDGPIGPLTARRDPAPRALDRAPDTDTDTDGFTPDWVHDDQAPPQRRRRDDAWEWTEEDG